MSQGLEAFSTLRNCYLEDGGYELINTIERELKALEIIKEKKVDTRALTDIFKKDWTWEDYISEENDINTGGHQFSNIRLTQHEYGLLKEVLL